ncbi:hypothetical protein HN954_01195 [bacterium]|jgi:hypothetical protein|nr:hypothetical protein [bacterium]MBT6832304.1 hypothetical protein [bacterium]MBT6996027.1 hypothetical protein [bacterium]MBT7772320.1 hypothetical protein [bacterium]
MEETLKTIEGTDEYVLDQIGKKAIEKIGKNGFPNNPTKESIYNLFWATILAKKSSTKSLSKLFNVAWTEVAKVHSAFSDSGMNGEKVSKQEMEKFLRAEFDALVAEIKNPQPAATNDFPDELTEVSQDVDATLN